MTSPGAAPHGILVVDKPPGPTSFAIVAGVRRLYRTRRVGHCGTLDPMASGVLVVLLGEATKLSNALTGADKSYSAEIRFGFSTDTLDALGKPQERAPLAPGWSAHAPLDEVLRVELRREHQVPPQFSAIKLDGRRAYRRARAGEVSELPERPVRVHALHAETFDDELLRLQLEVSKGYYVRSLARDVCETLGVPGHLSALRRTRSGCFDLTEAVPWPPAPETLPPLLDSSQAARRALPCAVLTEQGLFRAVRGQVLQEEHFDAPPHPDGAAWLSPDGQLIALGSATDEGYRVTRGFSGT